jgi:hypothetical protein
MIGILSCVQLFMRNLFLADMFTTTSIPGKPNSLQTVCWHTVLKADSFSS